MRLIVCGAWRAKYHDGARAGMSAGQSGWSTARYRDTDGERLDSWGNKHRHRKSPNDPRSAKQKNSLGNNMQIQLRGGRRRGEVVVPA